MCKGHRVLSTGSNNMTNYFELDEETCEQIVQELVQDPIMKSMFTATYELTAFFTGKRPEEEGDAEFDEMFDGIFEIIHGSFEGVYEFIEGCETLRDRVMCGAYCIAECFIGSSPMESGEDPEFDELYEFIYHFLLPFFEEDGE